jgi:hypothetical protein
VRGPGYSFPQPIEAKEVEGFLLRRNPTRESLDLPARWALSNIEHFLQELYGCGRRGSIRGRRPTEFRFSGESLPPR